MAIHWHWAWGAESSLDLATNAGFTFSSTTPGNAAPTSVAGEVYSYIGSPTRYSMKLTANVTWSMPSSAGAGVNAGWVAIPFKLATPGSLNVRTMLRVEGGSGRSTYVVMGASGALSLYVDSVFKATTAPYGWLEWRYVALKFDMSTTTFSGQLYVDEVAATADFTDPAAGSETSVTINGQSASQSLTWCLGQCILYDSLADAGELSRYVTRVEPNADGVATGTWTPSTGATQFGVVASPLNVTTYTENLAPIAGDKVGVVTDGGGANLASALGITPPSIDSVMVHTYSAGQSLTAFARVGDGTGTQAGANVLVDAVNTTYAWALANTRPALGGAWTPADAPTMVYEIASV